MNNTETISTRVLSFLQRIAILIFGILPIGLGLIAQFAYVFDQWSFSQLFGAGLFTVIIILPLIVVLIKDPVWNAIAENGYLPLLWVTVLSIAVRLVILPLLSTNFTSDFEDIHNFAVDVVSGHPYANLSRYPSIPWATHLNMTGLTMSLVYRIFGASFTTAKMFMLILAILTVWLVYLTGRELADARIGFIAASIYGTLPSLVCYTGVLTGEHFALPLVTLLILLYIRLKKAEAIPLGLYLTGYVLCGAIIGLMDWFRPGGIILLIALIITDLIYINREHIVYRLVLPLAVLSIAYLFVGNLAVTISENFFHTDVMSNSQKSGYFVLIGLNPDTEGRINLEDRGTAFETYERFKDDNAAANEYLIKLAMDRLQGQPVLDIFRSKFVRVWANHDQLFQISLNGSNDMEIVGIMSKIESVLYIFLTILIGNNIYFSLRRRSEPAVFAMQLFILGCAIWVLVLEAQNRYAIISFPYWIILASLGMNDLRSRFQKRSTPVPN